MDRSQAMTPPAFMSRSRQALAWIGFFLFSCLFWPARGTPVQEGLVGWYDASHVQSGWTFRPAQSSSAWWWEQWDTAEPFLKSAAPGGMGPLSLPGIWNQPRGWGHFTGGPEPDLFVRTTGFPAPGFYIFPFVRRTEEGIPVFSTPLAVANHVDHPLPANGMVLSSGETGIRAVWLEGRTAVFGLFDSSARAFFETSRVEIQGLPRNPVRVAVRLRQDGSAVLYFELTDGVSSQPPGPGRWEEGFRPYDAAGIWRGGFPYRQLYQARLPSWGTGPAAPATRMDGGESRVRANMSQISPVEHGSLDGVLTGSHYGGIFYFPHEGGGGGGSIGLEIAKPGGEIQRHPTVGPAVIVYPDPSGRPDLIVGGEGALYYYRHSGETTPDGRPVFEKPTPVLMENADLYAGSLPVVSVADWNGNGRFDLIAGNSEGRVLMFENIGTNPRPRFLPGVAIQAGAKEIHIQAGYKGSIQGVGEARWGYASPTVVDWTGNGLPDIVMGDITGSYTVYINRGTPDRPRLDRARPLFWDGLNLHGKWRVQPAVVPLGDGNVLVTVDGEDHLHLFRQIDHYNVESMGKLRLEDGSPISVSGGFSGHTGRAKLSLVDWDGDGSLDLLIGTARSNSIPNRETGFPSPSLSPLAGVVLFMKNVGTNEEPVFAHPVPIHYRNRVLYPGGGHAVTAAATILGGEGELNLLVGNQAGRFILLRRQHLSPP